MIPSPSVDPDFPLLGSPLFSTPYTMISRAVVGIRGASMIVNLPGSPKSVRENLSVILPALPHALSKLKGNPSGCAQE
jgi:molybdopterin biosynthesis enzyme MoaB